MSVLTKGAVLGPHPKRAAVTRFLLPLPRAPSPRLQAQGRVCLAYRQPLSSVSREFLVHTLAHVPTVGFSFMVLTHG